MRILYNTLCVIFILMTIGLIDIEVAYSDGTSFNYVGLIHRINDFINGE